MNKLYEDTCKQFEYFEYNNILFFQKGPLSQWFGGFKNQDSTFKLLNGLEFNCAEQYMMFCKAYHFGDAETAEEILLEKNPENHKDLGRKVKNFDSQVWNQYKMHYVYQGNVMKFSQNKYLFDFLMSIPDNLVIAENAPWDDVWGTGDYGDIANIGDSNSWPGQNLLGLVLMRVKIELKMYFVLNGGVVKPVYFGVPLYID